MPVPSGKTLDSDLFTSDTGWTKTLTSGSYTVTGGQGRFTAASGGANTLGIVRTTGTTSQPFTKYSLDFSAETGTNHNFWVSLSNQSTLGFASTFGAYVNGGGVLYVFDNGAVDVGFGAITNATYNVAIEIQPNRTAKLYINSVLQYTSVNFAGATITNVPLYMQVNVDKVNGNGILTVDNFLVTDQSAVEVERSLTSGSGFSQIATTNLGVQTYGDTGLSSSTTYYYRVRTNRGGDTSPYSAESSATTSGGGGGGGGGGSSTAAYLNFLIKEDYEDGKTVKGFKIGN